ncbi:DEAD/DEAH box helicase [SAR202 cluster bacterium AD-804-J14_MRT_500m]|nr:DEAD/DEAH box helicase [SAR202 cluster bacterium AD-804-J14_MRT_500m]
MDFSNFIDVLIRELGNDGQVVHWQKLPARDPQYPVNSIYVNPALKELLRSRNKWPLFTHQVDAINKLRNGANVIVTTPSASGKSLCYHVPTIDFLSEKRTNRVLYLFPTKALARDQMETFDDMTDGFNIRSAIFDGDTLTEERAQIRRYAQLIITNPDMLHLGILPNHRSWARLFRELKLIVIDEAHIYRGVFGSHVANVIRRLRRLCRIYGSDPQFVMCSATIGNPEDLSKELIGLPFEVVDHNGAGVGGRHFVFWNPPIVDKRKSLRRSTNTEVSGLLSLMVGEGVRTLAFVRTRRLAELVYIYTREILLQNHPELAERVGSYRAGYLAHERREIEGAFFSGELLGIAATNALELGIDIGELDATLLAGYPGTIAATWQQAGRSGRSGSESLTVLVARDDPVDQYLMNHPEFLFDTRSESVLMSPTNPHIMGPHLLCAAYETPISSDDHLIFGPKLGDQIQQLDAQGLLHSSSGKWHLSPEVGYAAEDVNLRSTGNDNYMVVEEKSGTILETVDEGVAFRQLHQGAVYLHRGNSYVVNRLEIAAKLAYVQNEDLPYYTQPNEVTDIQIVRAWESKTVGRVKVTLGEVQVTDHVVGYRRKEPFTERELSRGVLSLPPNIFDTVAFWFDVPQKFIKRCKEDGLDLEGGLHAGEHAAISILPLFAMCDRNDIGGVSTLLHVDTGRPQVFIYDGHPGGVGISEQGYHQVLRLWEATLDMMHSCSCHEGCPSCVQSPKCGNNNYPLDKKIAIDLFRELCK